jgi:predicted nucleic acid-binding protein
MAGNFLDTNVLVYSLSDDPVKADRAEELICGGGWISVQVLNELANVLRRKRQMSWPETTLLLTTLRNLLSVAPLTSETHETGISLAQRYGFSIYNSVIVAVALQENCDPLWSEDLQDGMTIENCLRIVNPFRHAGR